MIPQANLTSLDAIWTTAVVTRNHAFLVHDQVCAQDASGAVKPQMPGSAGRRMRRLSACASPMWTRPTLPSGAAWQRC